MNRFVVAGIGPAGPDLVPEATRLVIANAARVFLRTTRHPSAPLVLDLATAKVESFDHVYDDSDTFSEVYAQITQRLLEAFLEDGPGDLVYCVPGSPLVAEQTVELLRKDRRIDLEIIPAMSFLDLVWARLGVDPIAASVRIVDGTDFAAQAAGERGPLLVAQTYDRHVLSDVKLSVDEPPEGEGAAILLHHLGLRDEAIVPVSWAELDHDRDPAPDHLTSVWIPRLAAPVAQEMVRLVELVRTLREKCPWDQKQTHGSLARHLLEEAYEALDAIEDVAESEPDVEERTIAHMEEELGDLVFQVFFHSALASERGWFTLADVAENLRLKLVGRHPHVFGDAVANTPEDVARSWEQLKREEQGRSSITEGIPSDLPALALAAKLQRKAESVGLATGDLSQDRERIRTILEKLEAGSNASGETLEADRETASELGEALLAMADLARRVGVDPESALRVRARALADSIRQVEQSREA